jgi:hypothetical protein
MPNTPEKRREGAVPLPPSRPSSAGSNRARPYERLDAVIAEAVFGYHLQRLLADQPSPLRYYLALCGRDPDEALLRRLQTIAAGVEPRSQCRVSARTGVTDRATGAAGVILEVTSLSWIHVAAVEVVGGYYVTPWHAAALRYRVEWTREQWVVTAAGELWRV